jgi:septal ring-binding cell division protein DamX
MKTKQFVALALTTSLLTGCATPPMFVSASALTPDQMATIRSGSCDELVSDFLYNEKTEKQAADEMAGRAAKQLVLNAIGIGALAVGGFGMIYHVRGEGVNRERLADLRARVAALRTVIAEKGCRLPAPTAENAATEPAATEPAATAEPTQPPKQ